jgi:ribonuclease P protein component
VTFLADAPSLEPLPPRFAFALPRKVGNAVERNKIRRVVKGRLPEVVARVDVHTAAGAYLVAVRPGAVGLDAGTVADRVESCLDELWSKR